MRVHIPYTGSDGMLLGMTGTDIPLESAMCQIRATEKEVNSQK